MTAGTLYAGDPPRTGPDAFVVEGGKIAWFGSARGVPRSVPRERLDLGHAVVIPGFVDCHFHMLALLPTAGWADLRSARSVEDARRLLADLAPRVPEGRWLVGWGFDTANTGGRRLLRGDLDALSPDRPALVVEVTLHQGTINSAALASLGWGRTTPRWPGGELVRDRRGEPNGVVWERAFGVPMLKAVEAEMDAAPQLVSSRLAVLAAGLLSQGVTHVGEAFTPPRLADAFETTPLPMGLTMLLTSGRGLASSPWDVLEGRRTGDGDAHLGVGPIKLIADGAERGAMCLTAPQALRTTGAALWRALRSSDAGAFRFLAGSHTRVEDGKFRTGTLHYSRSGMAEITAAALDKGYRVAIHSLGNDAIDMALAAFEHGRRSTGQDVSGCRIEHFMLARPSDFDRAARLGLILSMQPGHFVHYAPTLRATAVDRLFEPVALRTAIEAGCNVAISTDGPTIPSAPLDSLRAAVDRIGIDGRPVAPGQAIGRTEALRAATMGGAAACAVDEVKGSIAVGKQADFAVLSGDPFDPATTVRETWVAGNRVWPADQATATSEQSESLG